MKSVLSILKLTTFLFFCLFLLPNTLAQDIENDQDVYEIITNDGNKFYGVITAEDTKTITLKTKNLGTLTIQKSNIKSREKINNNKYQDGEYWGPNLQANRYFWQPNAFSLKQGEGYYQNVWVFFNQVSVGVTDNFTLGVGMVPSFLFGIEATPVWFTPKVSIPIKKDKFNLGVGVLALTVIGGDVEDVFAGISYGVATIGSEDINLSFGLGYGFAGGGWADSPTFSISGLLRMNKRTSLMSENYFIGTAEDKIVLSFMGGRTVWDNLSLDYGLLIPVSEVTGNGSDFIGIPWLGLVIPFGSK